MLWRAKIFLFLSLNLQTENSNTDYDLNIRAVYEDAECGRLEFSLLVSDM